MYSPRVTHESEGVMSFTMYSTVWCGYCQRLKNQLGREGITFNEVDIEVEEAAAEIVEKANIRLRLVCATAARLPINKEPIASKTNICCQSSASGNKPSTSKRMHIAKAASCGAPPIISVTAVGAPW